MSKTEKKCPETAVTVQSTGKLAQNNDSTTDKEIQGVDSRSEKVQKELTDIALCQIDRFFRLGCEGKSACEFPSLTATSCAEDVQKSAEELLIDLTRRPRTKEIIGDDPLKDGILLLELFSLFAAEYVKGLQEHDIKAAGGYRK